MPNSSTLYLELDKTGQSINNLVQWEQHTLPNTATKLVIPRYGAFYSESVQLYWMDTDAYYIRLNDSLVLFNEVDYTISNNQITISYPLSNGDVAEYLPHFNQSGLAPFILRQVVGW